MKPIEPDNLLDYIPMPVIASKVGADGNIILLKPRFKPFWLRRIAKRLKQPDTLNIHLDIRGSRVWQHIDGCTTLGAIALKLPDDEDETRDGKLMRLAHFIRILDENDFIKLKKSVC